MSVEDVGEGINRREKKGRGCRESVLDVKGRQRRRRRKGGKEFKGRGKMK